ncbi:hypothetical protein ACEQPO_28610 [Bacillus sp. SL00103]
MDQVLDELGNPNSQWSMKNIEAKNWEPSFVKGLESSHARITAITIKQKICWKKNKNDSRKRNKSRSCPAGRARII